MNDENPGKTGAFDSASTTDTGDKSVSAVNFTGTGPAPHITSQQVSWWSVHEYVADVLHRIGSWPIVGTPAWESADDRTKVAALFDAARHWALRVETCQVAKAGASKQVSASAEWSTVGRGRDSAYIPRQVAA